LDPLRFLYLVSEILEAIEGSRSRDLQPIIGSNQSSSSDSVQ
jgi:hypothetical protein